MWRILNIPLFHHPVCVYTAMPKYHCFSIINLFHQPVCVYTAMSKCYCLLIMLVTLVIILWTSILFINNHCGWPLILCCKTCSVSSYCCCLKTLKISSLLMPKTATTVWVHHASSSHALYHWVYHVIACISLLHISHHCILYCMYHCTCIAVYFTVLFIHHCTNYCSSLSNCFTCLFTSSLIL